MDFGDVGLCGITKYICERKQRYKIALKRMPSYQILLFGIAKDLLKSDKISYSVEELVSAGDLLAQLKKNYPVLSELPSLRIAVDHHFPKPEFLVEENMEIALIPPVSGG